MKATSRFVGLLFSCFNIAYHNNLPVSLSNLPRILDSALSSKRAHKVAGESRYSNAVMISYDLRYHVKKFISLLSSNSVLYVAMARISHFLLYYTLH